MAAETLEELLISVKYVLDEASKGKVFDQIDKHLAKITEEERQGGQARLTVAQKFTAAVNAMLGKSGDARAAMAAGHAKTMEEAEAKSAKRRAEMEQRATEKRDAAAAKEQKKGQEQRRATLKEAEALALQVQGISGNVSSFINSMVGGAALGGFVKSVAQEAGKYSDLAMQAQRVGSSPRGIQAYAYAMQQMGVPAGEANSTLEGFSEKLRDNPQGFRNVIEGMGIRTTDGQGKLRETTAVLEDLGKYFASLDYNVAKIQAGRLGISENPLIALRKQDQLQAGVQDYDQKLAAFGFDPDKAAEDGRKFQASSDRLATDLGIIKDKIEAQFFKPLTDSFDGLAKWLEAHPKIAEGFGDGLVAFSILMAARVLPVLARLTGAMSLLGAIVPPAWLLRFIGPVGAAAAVMNPTDLNADEPQIMPDGTMRYTIGGKQVSKDEYLAAHGHASGGLPAADTRNIWQKYAPKWAGGQDAPAAAAGGRGASLGQRGGRPAKGALAANQKEAYAAALGEGLSPTAARALVADMSGEGLANDAHRVHWDGTHPSGGIVQWDPTRAAAIKAKFGKVPWELSVADQTRAAIWEYRTNPRFARTKAAMEGNDPHAMIHELVHNYEDPADKLSAINTREAMYAGFKPSSPDVAVAAAVPPVAPASAAQAGQPVLSDYMSKGGILSDEAKARYDRDRAAYQARQFHPDAGREGTTRYSRRRGGPNLFGFGDNLEGASPAMQWAAYDFYDKGGGDMRSGALKMAPPDFKLRYPLGHSPALHQSINSRGDTSHNFTQNVTVNGVQHPVEVADAVKANARRGTQEFVRNMQGTIT